MINTKEVKSHLPDALNLDSGRRVPFLLSKSGHSSVSIYKSGIQENKYNSLVDRIIQMRGTEVLLKEGPLFPEDATKASMLAIIANKVMVYIEDDFFRPEIILAIPQSDPFVTPEIVRRLKNVIRPYSDIEMENTGKINLLRITSAGLTTVPFEINRINLDLTANYNDGFLSFHHSIKEQLDERNAKGMVFLHGQPGTGKTTYIRHLITELNKKVILVPGDQINTLASPEFLTFMTENKNSIMVIEDAENVLERRDQTRSSVISNLLNMSDGILADCLNIQFICTFNVDIKRIDNAFFRSGRLLGAYEFEALDKRKARELAMKHKLDIEITGPMTLADIFNKTPQGGKSKSTCSPIGFAS